MSKLLQLMWLVIGAAWLHALSVMPVPYDNSQWTLVLGAVQPDLLLCLALAVIGGAAHRPKLFAHVAAGLLVLTTLIRVGMVAILLWQNRAYELSDTLLAGALYDAWLDSSSPGERWLWSGVLLLSLWLVYWLSARAFRLFSASSLKPLVAAAWLIALQSIALVGGTILNVPMHRSVLIPFVDEVARSAGAWMDPEGVSGPIRESVSAGAARMAETPHGLELLDGVDVHVLVVESYGRVALRHPKLQPRVRALLAESHIALKASGFGACTAICDPAVIGGLSGLVHAELLTGVRVPDEQTRAALFESELLALPHRFRDVGYHTVEVQPAMNVEWAEGKAFYGIDESIWQEQLDYSGPRYDFGHMPDQFSLHYLLKNVVEPAEKPLFTLFIGVSSHAPWSLIPPYIPDWQIDSESFAHATAKRHEIGYGTMLRSPAALPAYFDAIEYSLRTAFDFARRLPRASLVIVVGDHQPPIATSITPSDYTHEVPIHVISNRMDLVARCRVLGFVDGLDVPDTFPSFPMSEVAPALLRTFSK